MRLLFAIVCLFVCVDAYKILVYSPRFGHSHSNFMGRIADTLVAAGHNVTTLIPTATDTIADGTTESTIIHVDLDDETSAMFNAILNSLGGDFDPFQESNFSPIGAIMQGRIFGEMFARMCRAVINKPGLTEQLRADAYDVLIAEPFDVCGIGMAPYIAPKSTIVVSSSVLIPAMYSDLGIPRALSFNPTMPMSSMDPHSMFDRLWNLIGQVCTFMPLIKARLLAVISFAFPRGETEAVLRERFGYDQPSIASIASHAAVVFTNGEPLLNVAAPTLHKVVDIAGLGAKAAKPLEKKWLDILTLRSRTVLISFGSIAKSSKLKKEAKRAILGTVAHFPDVTFIWKYETTEDDFATQEASKLSNLILAKWMPQNDLLNHIRIAAFVTHGGMGSVQETARRGVPAILVPLFGDQQRNALMLKERGIGKILDKQHIANSVKIIDALDEILRDSSYSARARDMARKLASKPFSAQELLVKHVEFAAQFGPSDALRPASIDMSIVELYNLDLLLLAIIIFSAVSFLAFRLVQFSFRRILLKNKIE